MAYRKIPQSCDLVPPEDIVVRFTGRVKRAVLEAAGDLGDALIAAIGASLPVTASEFQALEQRVAKAVRQAVAAPVMRAVLQALHDDQRFVWACIDKARALRGLRPDRSSSVPVRLLCGEVAEVYTPYSLQPRAKRPGPKRPPGRHGIGGFGCFPVLAQVGIADRATPALRSEVAWATAALGSLAEAQASLARRGIELHVNVMRLISQRVADAGIADREAEAEPAKPSPLAGKSVIVAIDGGRIRLRRNKPGRPRKSGWHGYETPWREPKLMAVYTVGEDGRKDGEFLFYEGTLEPYDGAFVLFVRCLRRLGIGEARQVVFAADGSDHVWNRVPGAVKALGLDPDRVRTFVDFWHAVQHLHDASKLVGLTPYEASLRARAWRKLLKAGRAEVIANELGAAAAVASGEEAQKQLTNAAAYFRGNAERMRYPDLRAAGLPRGTGAVESAVRRVVNLRLKSTGTFWDEENAERMLLLRCRLKAGRWDDLEAAMHRHAFGLRGNALKHKRAQARTSTPP